MPRELRASLCKKLGMSQSSANIDGRGADGDGKKDWRCSYLHENENEPGALGHGVIIAVAQADELGNACCPCICRDLVTIEGHETKQVKVDECTDELV